ncbi:zinc ribbon domain-containing protein [Candidatus Thorarchaeota archaeon]|nr:MAG: zinc ribbon domain-containing protein [Candidatus Thorarchaeota archaeon]
MKTSDSMLLGGGVLLILGGVLVALSNMDLEGVIVIFPFLVIGELSPVVAAVAITSILLPLVVFMFMFRNTHREAVGSPHGYWRRNDRCPKCGALPPPEAEYCHKCGWPLREEHNP